MFLTPTEAAKILNVSLSTLKKFIYTGQLKTLKTPGGHHRILESDLFEMLRSHPGISPSYSQKKMTLFEVAEGFVDAVENRQVFGKGHALSVARISLKIGCAFSLTSFQQESLYLAALLHDVGMLDINEVILNKEGPLDDKEYEVIKTHPLRGEEIVDSLEHFNGVATIVKQHHERFDGKGYPEGLKGEGIWPEAKIIALAEALACMNAEKGYKKPLSSNEIIEEVKRSAGGQFDPYVAEVFFKVFSEGVL